MQHCKHAGETRYARFYSSDGHNYYAVQCVECGKPIKTKTHNGKLRIKHIDIPTGETVFNASEVMS